MRIILIRHGESEGNIDDYAYVEKGDERVGLTDKGHLQAVQAGLFLNEYYKRIGLKESPSLFVSSYQRAQETLTGINFGLDAGYHGEPKEDVRLIEQNFGALAYLKHSKNPLRRIGADIMFHFAKAVHKGTPFSGRTPFGDSPKDIFESIKSFGETLDRDIKNGEETFTIVSHGAVIKAFMMAQFHLPMSAWQDLDTPGNTDIFVIDGEPENWSIKRIFDGEKGIEDDTNPIEHIQQLRKDTLPKFPEHLEEQARKLQL